MFVRVKKIGAYEYLYLVDNAREGPAVMCGSSRRSGGPVRSGLRV
jgi:hypothetical protein